MGTRSLLPPRPAVTSAPLLANRYLLLEEIGRGGHASVYRARDQRLERDVAVKLLRPDSLSDNVVARFQREIRLTAALEHPHILHVQDTGVHEGRPFLVVELAPDGTLADRLARDPQLPIADALQVTREVGLALAFAHAHDVVHRDVKPANILLREGTALLADFGVAFSEPEALQQRLTSAGLAVGTAQYMSPEQLCADPAVDARSDQYSLALVLYEMLAGVPAQTARTVEGLRLQRMAAAPMGVRTHRAAVPEAIEQALQVALAPVPADRFRDMTAFLSALGIAMSGEHRVPGTGAHAMASASMGGSRSSASVSGRRAAGSGGLRARGVLLASALLLIVGWGASRWWGAWSDVASASSAPVEGLTIALTSPRDDTLAQRVRGALEAELGAWPEVHVATASAPASAWRLVSSATPLGDSVRVRLTVTRGAEPPRQLAAIGLLSSDEALRALTARLVREVLAGATAAETPGLAVLPSRSLAALRAYVDGHRQLRAGALDSAEASFRRVHAEVPAFGDAAFWAAQVASWLRPRDRASWRGLADHAASTASESELAGHLVHGLQRLAQAETAGACDSYRLAITEDPASYVAWFGLGECTRLDTVVIGDAGGLRYRSSIWAALRAYRQAIESAPSSAWLAAVYPSIRAATFAQGHRARSGWQTTPGRAEYRALPALRDDTIEFVPIPRAVFEAGGAAAVPVTFTAAVRRARLLALDLTRRWVERDPKSAAGWLEHAAALELAGQLRRQGGTEASVDDALRRASSAVNTAEQRAQLAVLRVRLALRRTEFDSAAHHARAALRDTNLLAVPGVGATLAPLAALIGDTVRALAATPDLAGSELPRPLVDAVHEYTVLAVTGQCARLPKSRARLDAAVRASVPDADTTRVRDQVVVPALRHAVPCLGPELVTSFPARTLLDEAHRALAAGRREEVRDRMRALRQQRVGASSSSVTWDYVFAEAWVLVQAGDSAQAHADLRAAFDDIAGMSGYTLDYVAQAAGLRRALWLLDSLDAQRPTDEAARRWSQRARPLLSPPTLGASQ